MHFEQFTMMILKNKQADVPNLSGLNTIYSAAINYSDPVDIDFNSFSLTELEIAQNMLFEAVRSDDDDGYIILDKEHLLTKVINQQYKINALVSAPKQIAPTPFRFI